MGWTESPPPNHFTAFTETVVDVGNALLQHGADPAPHRLEKVSSSVPPPPKDGRPVYYEGHSPNSINALPPRRLSAAPYAALVPLNRYAPSYLPPRPRRAAPTAATPVPSRTALSPMPPSAVALSPTAPDSRHPCNLPPRPRPATSTAATLVRSRTHHQRVPRKPPSLEYFDAQGTPARLGRVRRILIHALDNVFQPLEPGGSATRQEPASVKKMLKGDACWATLKTVLGWVLDTIKGTIELPPHRIARIKELFDTFCGRHRVAIKTSQAHWRAPKHDACYSWWLRNVYRLPRGSPP